MTDHRMLVKAFTSDQEIEVRSCLIQWFRDHRDELSEDLFVISVWFSDVAQQYLGVDCPSGQYHLMKRELGSYQVAENQEIIQDIWQNNFWPIEVIKEDGCVFFGVPRPEPETKHKHMFFYDEKHMDSDLMLLFPMVIWENKD